MSLPLIRGDKGGLKISFCQQGAGMCAIPSPFRGTGTHPTGKGADEVSHFILIKNDLIKRFKRK